MNETRLDIPDEILLTDREQDRIRRYGALLRAHTVRVISADEDFVDVVACDQHGIEIDRNSVQRYAHV